MSVSISLPHREHTPHLYSTPLDTFQYRRLGSALVESHSYLGTEFVGKTFSHGVVEAATLAFSDHLPLALRPDDFWLMIAQGFALHVQQHSERLRHTLVHHEGKVEIKIYRNFTPGDENNDWPGAVQEFVELLTTQLKVEQHLPQFSTTEPADEMAFRIALMDAMAPYFRYTLGTLCGIPSVLLDGTQEDWQKVLSHTRLLRGIDPQLTWWFDNVESRLQSIISCFTRPDSRMWDDFFKSKSESGSPAITGWIRDFFPYLLAGKRTVAANEWNGSWHHSSFPSGISTVPFLWKFLADEIPMQFSAGHLGATWLDGHVRPVIGWAIQNKTSAVPEPRERNRW